MAANTPGTVREAMHEGAECIGENKTLLDAAKRMAELDVGVLPICGDDDRLKGMLTDRDIVVKALAQGRDPAPPRAASSPRARCTGSPPTRRSTRRSA